MKSRFLLIVIFSLFPALCYGGNDNSVSLSYSETSGNTNTKAFSAGYQITKDIGKWNFYSEGNYLYKEDNGKESANRVSMENRGERSISEKLSFFVKNFIFSDRFSGYDFRVGIGPGIAWYPLKTEKQQLRIGTTVSYVYNNYADGTTDSYGQSEISVDYTRQLKENVQFEQGVDYQISLKNGNDYFIHSKTNLKVGLTENLSLEISYTVDYQNLLPEGTEYHTDKTFFTGVVYSF